MASKTTNIRQHVWDSPAPAVAGNTAILAAVTLPTSGTTTSTVFVAQPDVPRTIRLKGNQTTTQGLVVTINGTDFEGNAISEAVTMGGAFATPTDSANAFASVTSIVFPTRGGASDTISAGFGAALGLGNICDAYSFKGIAGVTSYTYDPAIISKNTVTLSATLDGSTAQAIIYVPALFRKFGRIYG